MPKIFEYIGFIFYFFSNDHEPIHVHVIKGGKEVRIELLFEKDKLAGISITKANRHTQKLTGEEREKIRIFIEAKHPEIRKKWNDFRAGKKVTVNRINKEIK